MNIYKLSSDRMAIDMGTPNPIISIPNAMWEQGLKNFNGSWVKCYYTKATTDNDRILFTIYGDEQYEYTELDSQLCLYHGIKDTTGNSWSSFESFLDESATDDLGYSYREIYTDDTRQWWEFHIYDETVELDGNRPDLEFAPAILEEL